jgi:protein TonB
MAEQDDRRGIDALARAVDEVASGLGPVAAPRAAGIDRAAASEELLRVAAEEVRPRRLVAFVLAASVLHALAFAITFPEIKYQIRDTEREKQQVFVRKYTPPPPKVERRQVQRKEIKKKMPVPDPTPEEPEPIIEPEPEPIPEEIPPDVEVLLGEPEPPPVTGPLMAGVGGVTTPELIPETRVEPEYPELARRARIQGKVFLQAVIRKDGTVGDIKVLKEPPGDLGFADAAIAAVSQWRYRAAKQSGRPVDVYFTVMVNFTLE